MNEGLDTSDPFRKRCDVCHLALDIFLPPGKWDIQVVHSMLAQHNVYIEQAPVDDRKMSSIQIRMVT